MKPIEIGSLVLAAALAAGPVLAAAPLEIRCPDKGVCREVQTGMPLKILPRPFSNIYDRPDAQAAKVLQENVRAFYPLYVFAREGVDTTSANDPKGWYQVGPSVRGAPTGWMKAKDVLEWKQALIVAYTHPGEGEDARHRVLMFSSKDRLEAILDAPDRVQKAKALYEAIEEGRVPDGVVSKEPERFVDITEKFYLLPIVDFEQREIDGDDTRLLQIAAAIPGGRSDKDTLDNPEFRKAATAKGELSGKAAEALTVDVVFVMDMTGSMQPYIDQTKAALKRFVQGLTQQAENKVRFGLVGYRDDVRKMPKVEFTAKNFTPKLVEAPEMVRILSDEAQASKVGSGDYAEEVYAGMKMALESNWDADALKFIILVGDASAHPPGHPQNTTGLDAKTLRRLVEDRQVHVLAMHLQDPRAAKDHATAEEQFRTLSRIRGKQEKSAYVAIDVGDQGAFQKAVESATGEVLGLIRRLEQERAARREKPTVPQAAGTMAAGAEGAAQEGELQDLPAQQAGQEALQDLPAQPAPQEALRDLPAQAAAQEAEQVSAAAEAVASEAPLRDVATSQAGTEEDEADPAKQAGAKMGQLIEAALVEYLGKEQTPPRDVIAWAFDRDLTDPATQALEVRVLLNKQQLSDLMNKLKAVSTAMKKAEITQMAFFDALASVAAGTVKDPDQIRNADKLKDAGLLDAFIASLPYKSDILNLSNEAYAAMTPAERADLQRGIDAKLELYRIVNEDVEGWVKLNETDDDSEKVYPLHIDALP